MAASWKPLRYIHGNPRAAPMAEGFDWPCGNYAAYARALDDGLERMG